MFWLKNKQRGSLTPSFPLLTFFSFPRRIVYLLCFMHWVTIDIDKNSTPFCFPHSRNWAGKGGGPAGNKAKKSLTPLPAKGDQGEEGNGCTTITIVLKTNDRTAFFTFNINKTNSQWVYFITLITIHNTKQSLCKKKGNPPSPESKCSTYSIYVKNFILTRTRARVIPDARSRQRLKNDAKK